MCLGYNIKRAKSLLRFEKLMELMATQGCRRDKICALFSCRGGGQISIRKNRI